MTNTKMTPEEKDLLQAYESGEYVSDLTQERKAQLSDAAKASSKKDKRMNVRISSRDMEALQRRALQGRYAVSNAGFQCAAQVSFRWAQRCFC